eukprot:6315147-Karenia_brevis.AAC.1
MTRASKALTGWGKRGPGQGRKVFPEECVYAIIGDLLQRGHVLFAMNHFLQYLAYLRPGETD